MGMSTIMPPTTTMGMIIASRVGKANGSRLRRAR
jgi:hypothetical protein